MTLTISRSVMHLCEGRGKVVLCIDGDSGTIRALWGAFKNETWNDPFIGKDGRVTLVPGKSVGWMRIMFERFSQCRTWKMNVNKDASESRTGAIRASTAEGGTISLSIRAPEDENWTKISLDVGEVEELIDGLLNVLGEKGATE